MDLRSGNPSNTKAETKVSPAVMERLTQIVGTEMHLGESILALRDRLNGAPQSELDNMYVPAGLEALLDLLEKQQAENADLVFALRTRF